MTALFPVVVVHCFFGWCSHVERGLDPVAVHDQMEVHYRAGHQGDIAAITGPWRVVVIPGVELVIK